MRERGEFATVESKMNGVPANFAQAVACVEALPLEDQAALVEVVNKRISAARRQEMLHEIATARADRRSGKVKRGSASDLMRELRGRSARSKITDPRAFRRV